MPIIQLKNRFSSDVTIISNAFIDAFMVDANGEYVKIYLYILRLSLSSDETWTLNTIADKLECTTKDVIRALNYWVRKGLLVCEYDEDKQLNSLTFIEPASVLNTEEKESEENQEVTEEKEAETHVSAARLRELKKNEEVKMILYAAEQYFGRPLTTAEVETLLYFYDEEELPADLVEYLVEYCVSKNAKNLAYLKKVGFAWIDEGITTVSEAKESALSKKEYYTILNAYGLSGRNPVAEERKYMKRWIREYGFSEELILMAVERTMAKIHAPRFEYTDSILKSWKESGVRSAEDVNILDAKHNQEVSRSFRQPNQGQGVRSDSRGRKKTGTGFSNFQERSYDYESLEKQLLNIR